MLPCPSIGFGALYTCIWYMLIFFKLHVRFMACSCML